DWFVQPLVVNAFYEATGNAVIFPVGILRTPIFNPDRPKYLNYGMLGVVIGHEITHGFDNSGRKFDKVGNLTQWWSDDIVDKFKEQAACFVEQYSQLPIDIVGQNVNGNQTLDDNICDNSGLKQAYRAYKNYVSKYGEEPSLPGISYSNLQVFFLQYAQWNFELRHACDHQPLRRCRTAYTPPARASAAVRAASRTALCWRCPRIKLA
ncbi:neprilysin, partial [Nephila pilipes]